MTVIRKMRVGRPRKTIKMTRMQFVLEPELIVAIKALVPAYKRSAWVRSALWAAVKK